jgi:hypothetical protein
MHHWERSREEAQQSRDPWLVMLLLRFDDNVLLGLKVAFGTVGG